MTSGTQLAEARGREVAVEGERPIDGQRAHEPEAGRVDVGVLTLVVATQPAEGVGFDVFGHREYLDARGALQGLEEVDGGAKARAPPEERPRLTSDVVARDERPGGVGLEQGEGAGVAVVPPVAQRYPE
jgi:hypothetical protein